MIEYLDVLDENGNKIGQKLPIDEVNNRGLWHLSVNLWVVTPDHKILLHKRSQNKNVFPGMWAHAAAGHVSSGESSVEGMIKEAREEVGLDIKPQDLKKLFSYRKIDNLSIGPHRSWFDVYLVEKDIEIKDIKINPEEVEEAKLVTLHELEHMVANPDLMLPFPDEYPEIIDILKKRWGE